MDLPVITITEDTNCASLIAELLLEHYKIKEKSKYLSLLTGFGQGLKEGTLCGAVSGAYLAISTVLSGHGATKIEIEEVQTSFKSYFKNKYDSVNCGDILSEAFGRTEAGDDVRQSRFCGTLLDSSTNEVIELVNLAISAMNPIMARYHQL